MDENTRTSLTQSEKWYQTELYTADKFVKLSRMEKIVKLEKVQATVRPVIEEN